MFSATYNTGRNNTGSRFNLFAILQRNGCWKSPKDRSYIFRHNETVQSSHFLIPKIHVSEGSPFNFFDFLQENWLQEFQRLYILFFLGSCRKEYLTLKSLCYFWALGMAPTYLNLKRTLSVNVPLLKMFRVRFLPWKSTLFLTFWTFSTTTHSCVCMHAYLNQCIFMLRIFKKQKITQLTFLVVGVSKKIVFLFSVHISYGKTKYVNQTFFFLQNLPRTKLYPSKRVSPLEFNWCKISIMRYVFVEIFGLFWLTPKTPEWPKNHPKINKKCKIFQFYATFVK